MQAEKASAEQPGIFIFSSIPSPAIQEVPELLKSGNFAPIKIITKYPELRDAVREISHGCVVFDLREGEDLKNLAEFASLIRNEIDDGILQLLVMCQIQHPKIGQFLGKLNCSRILYPPFTSKGLKIAIGRHMEMSKKDPAARSDRPGALNKGAARKATAQVQKTVKEFDPVKTSDDCWLGRTNAVRSIQGRWLCKMTGPGPVTGAWREIKSTTVSGKKEERLWEWQPAHPEKDLFIKQGVWRFLGRLPEFRDDAWTFIGTQPELGYYQNDVLVEKRFFCESADVFMLAKNSEAALKKLPDIQASIEFEVTLKSQKPKSAGAEYVDQALEGRALEAEIEGEENVDGLVSFEKEATAEDGPEIEQSTPDAEEKYASFESEAEGALDAQFGRSPGASSKKSGFFKGEAATELESPTRAKTDAPPFGRGKFGEKSVAPNKLEFFQKADEVLASSSKLFKFVDSPVGRTARFKESHRALTPTTLWTPHRTLRESTSVVSPGRDENSLRIAYPNGWTKSEMLDQLKSKNADRLYFNINTRRTSIFFVHPLLDIKFLDENMDVKEPPSMYEVQRRDHFRYPFLPPHELKVTIGLSSNQQQPVEVMAHDISAGGLALFSAETRLRRLEIGQVLPNVSFTLYGKAIRCGAQVRWKKEFSPSETRLGLQFLNLSPEDREGIRFFVMEESFDYLESVLDAELAT